MLNPRATFSSDIKLMMALNFYDKKINKKYIYELNENSQFIFNITNLFFVCVIKDMNSKI